MDSTVCLLHVFLVTCRQPMDLVLALEISSNVQSSDVSYMTQFLQSLLERLYVNRDVTRVGVVIFGQLSRNIRYLNTDIQQNDLYYNVRQTIESLRSQPLQGGTNTSGCFETIRKEQLLSQRGERSNVANTVLLITASGSNVDAHRTVSEAENLKSTNTRLMAIGAGNRFDRREIDDIVSNTYLSETKWFVSSFSQIYTIVDTVARAMCAYQPPLPPTTEEVDVVGPVSKQCI